MTTKECNKLLKHYQEELGIDSKEEAIEFILLHYYTFEPLFIEWLEEQVK